MVGDKWEEPRKHPGLDEGLLHYYATLTCWQPQPLSHFSVFKLKICCLCPLQYIQNLEDGIVSLSSQKKENTDLKVILHQELEKLKGVWNCVGAVCWQRLLLFHHYEYLVIFGVVRIHITRISSSWNQSLLPYKSLVSTYKLVCNCLAVVQISRLMTLLCLMLPIPYHWVICEQFLLSLNENLNVGSLFILMQYLFNIF